MITAAGIAPSSAAIEFRSGKVAHSDKSIAVVNNGGD
jgi:hypothetical protein